MKKSMLILVVVLGSTLAAITTKATVSPNPCGHPCSPAHNACCTWVDIDEGSGDIIAGSYLGVHKLETAPQDPGGQH